VLRRSEFGSGNVASRKANIKKMGPHGWRAGEFWQIGAVGEKNKIILFLGLDIARLHQ
jgi:hypothetical protein